MSDQLDELESTLPQAPNHPPAAIAGELLIDGLLRYHASTDQVARERRIARVVEAVGEESRPLAKSSAPAARSFRLPRWLITAAAIVLGTAGLLLLIPSEQSASADLKQLAARLRKPGDIRFEVSLNPWGEPDITNPDTVDMRFPEGLLVIHHQHPREQGQVVVGKDAQGYWSIRRDGTINRVNPERHLPLYITLDGASLFDNSLDKFLDALPTAYDVERLPSAALKPGEQELDRVQATRRKTHAVLADTVLLWIDPVQHEIQRIEFGWTDPDTRIIEEGQRPPSPQGHRGPPPGDRPPPGGRRPPEDGQGPGDRPPQRGEGDSQRGPRAGPRGGTPRSLIFQRVPTEPHPADWFSAEGHASNKQP
jgi:hypothetical protein